MNLGNELHNLGYGIHYLAFHDINPKYEFSGKYYTFNQIEKKNNFNKAVHFVKNVFKIKNICIKKNIDTIISVGEISNYYAILSSILGNKSKIIATHHTNPESFNNRAQNLMKILYPKADNVICVSKAMENIFKYKMGIKNNISTIYNTLDIKKCIELSEENISEEYQKIFDSKFVFINIGRLDGSKGQWYLIRSFKKVVDKYNDVMLFILGEGIFKKELENLIKEQKIENNVILLGNQNNIFPFLKNSSCFVFSSVSEGFPMTLIESLSINIPIISTDCETGPREILCPELSLGKQIKYPYCGNYGILTKPFNRRLIFETVNEKPLSDGEELLANLMIKVIEENKLRKKYSNGLERAWNFDKTKIIGMWEESI